MGDEKMNDQIGGKIMKYQRTFNFSAGPAMMPEPVLEEIRQADGLIIGTPVEE